MLALPSLSYLHSIMLLLYHILGVNPRGAPAQSTFHYASTLSINLEILMISQTYLHSIMLLLYLNCGQAIDWEESESTFHYASTLSGSSGYYAQIGSSSTFHYASTLSGDRWTRTDIRLIYIPLCFYFIE